MFPSHDPQISLYVPSINADSNECAELGIIICSSAGNNGQVISVRSGSTLNDPLYQESYDGPFWDSYFQYDVETPLFDSGSKIYYQRPSVPRGTGVVKCADINYAYLGGSSPKDNRKLGLGLMEWSGRGPRIDAAALTATACADISNFSYDLDYPIHTNYIDVTNIPGARSVYNKTSIGDTGTGGTSFAAPQIAGMACLWKQLYPT